MIDVICIGTVSIDLYYKGESLTHSPDRFELAIGGKYFSETFYEGLGGGGANVAIGIKKCGLQPALMASIGDNSFKALICEKLDIGGVIYHSYSDIIHNYTNISSILLTEKGEKTIINYRTQHDHIITSEADYPRFIRAKTLYMANMANVSLSERIKILTFSKKNGVCNIVNLNVSDCRRSLESLNLLLKNVDVLIVNGYEFADIVKTSYESVDFNIDITKKYAPHFDNIKLVVTDGSKGSYSYIDGKVIHQPAIKVDKIVDTTGAGDAFTAGFISHFIKSKGDMRESMTSGAQYATTILTHIGAN